jgi:hypothetical protein
MSFNATEYRRLCKDQDVAWLLQERQKHLRQSEAASWLTGLGISLKLNIVANELREREVRSRKKIYHLDPHWQDHEAGSPRSSSLISRSANEETKSSQSTAHIAQTQSYGANPTLGYNLETAYDILVDDKLRINPEVTKYTDSSRGTITKAHLKENLGDTSSGNRSLIVINRQPQRSLVWRSQDDVEELPFSRSKLAPRKLFKLLPEYNKRTVPKSAKDWEAPFETGKSFEVARAEPDSEEPSRKRATGRESPSIWLTIRPLVAVTVVFVLVHFLVRMFGEGFTFKTSAFSYSILILVTTFWQSKLEQAQAMDLPSSYCRFRSPFLSLRAIILILLDFLHFVTFYIRENLLYTAAFVTGAGSFVGKRFFIALSLLSPEAPKATGMVRIRWTCVCT